MDANLLRKILQPISGLNYSDLFLVRNAIDQAINVVSTKEQINISNSLPEIKYPAYLMLANEEFIFIEFIKEFFLNFEKDFLLTDPEIASNDNSPVITNSFNDLDEKKGQFPRIVVEAIGTQTDKRYMANVSALANDFTPENEFKSNRSVSFEVPMRISVISTNKNEANILAASIMFAIIENQDLLRNFCKIEEITPPSLQGAQNIRQFQKLFMTNISFSVKRQASWSNVFKMKANRDFYIRLRAKFSPNDDNPLVTLIYKVKEPVSDFFNKYMTMLNKVISK